MSDLKIDEYQQRANETAIYPGKGEVMGLAYTVLGLTGEAGEVANKVKKVLRDSGGKMTDEMRTKIREELGGVYWYLAQTATELGVPLSLIAQENLDILAKRKAEGKIKGDGDDRGTTRDALKQASAALDAAREMKATYERDFAMASDFPPMGFSGGQCISCHTDHAEWTKPCEMVPPVDRSQRTTSDGEPPTCDGPAPKPIDPKTGQHESYWVLSEDERAKGFVRPLRRTYYHRCGCATSMGISIAETYARDPKFYSHTFCCACQKHLPVGEFTWDGAIEKLGD